MAFIPNTVMERIRDRAEEAYPEECCGFLTGFAGSSARTAAGTGNPGNEDVGASAGAPVPGDADEASARTVRVLEQIPVRNAAAAEDRRREFLVEPKDLLDVMKRYRNRDEDVVGFYHSHPDHEAELSPTDLKFARLWPRTVWLIVPVTGREAGEGKSETGQGRREGGAEIDGIEGIAGTAGTAGQERAWWLAGAAGNPRDRDAARDLENVQEMIIRSSGSAAERTGTAEEAAAPRADRTITPREERV